MVLVELLDEESARLSEDGRTEVLITPAMLSHMLAQITLRRELGEVFDERFGPGGAEIRLRPARDFGLGGEEIACADLRQAAQGYGELALGLRLRGRAGAIWKVHRRGKKATETT